jgi:tetratricopeptide (TPR) repeat protein
MKVENTAEAESLLTEAEARYNQHRGKLGERDEDETLLEGKPGRIYFDKGKIAFLNAAGVNKVDNVRDFPGKKIYPARSLGQLSAEESSRRNGLINAKDYFKQALETEGGIVSDPKMLREVQYYLGWIDYNSGEFSSALDYWAELPDEDLYNNPTLLLGKGNAFYYTRQYNAALGNYLKLKDDYEERELTIGRLEPENSDHQEIYQSLTALYNNIGAVYEKKQEPINALKYYWKAMETARRIGIVSEIATSNKDLVFARARLEREPLLEDWLPPTLDKIKDMK